jgi:arginyl-tRNA synthetase
MAQSNIISQLAQKVEGLTISGLLQKYPDAHPEVNPLDLYRAHLSDVMSKVSGVETSIIYPVVMWTQALDKGDFVIAVPALRIKGKKPDILAQEWADKVRFTLDFSILLEDRLKLT